MLVFIVRRLLWAFLLVGVITLITFIIFLMLPDGTVGSRRALVTPNLAAQWNLQHRLLPTSTSTSSAGSRTATSATRSASR